MNAAVRVYMDKDFRNMGYDRICCDAAQPLELIPMVTILCPFMES